MSLCFGLGEVLLVVAALEEAAVDFRVERFDPAVEQFGCAGVFGNVDDRQAGLAERLGGAAGGEQFDSEVMQFLGERGEAGFVGNGEKGAGDGHGWWLSRGWWGVAGAIRWDFVTKNGVGSKRNRAGGQSARSADRTMFTAAQSKDARATWDQLPTAVPVSSSAG